MRVFKLKGDTEYITAGLPGMRLLNTSFFAERDNSDPLCRWEKSREWCEIELHPYPNFNHRQGQECHFTDAINARNIVFGAGIIVSDTSKIRLTPYIEHEYVFLPVHLVRAPQKYWFMYVANILDCLNSEKSKFKTNRFSPKSIKHYWFDGEKLEDVYLFRLPGHLHYLEDRDFATSRFLELVKKLKLEGFEFWECNKPDQDPIVTGID